MDFVLYDEDRRRLAGGDDDWSPGGDDYYFYDDYYGDQDRFDPVEDCRPAWPYAVRDESPDDSPEDGVYATTRGWHLKMPHDAYKAYREIRKIRDGVAEVAHADVPSLFCGDCPYLAHLSGDYGGFPFTVNTTGFPGAHGALFDTSAVPDRRRTYVEPNVVLVGAFMTTVRYETEACVEGEDLFEEKQDATCLVGRKPDGEHPWRYQKARRERFDREPFGVDPTFVSTSPLFRSTNSYETWYDDDELRPMIESRQVGLVATPPVEVDEDVCRVVSPRVNFERFCLCDRPRPEERGRAVRDGPGIDQEEARVRGAKNPYEAGAQHMHDLREEGCPAL